MAVNVYTSTNLGADIDDAIYKALPSGVGSPSTGSTLTDDDKFDIAKQDKLIVSEGLLLAADGKTLKANLGEGVTFVSNAISANVGSGLTINSTTNKIEPNLGYGFTLDSSGEKLVIDRKEVATINDLKSDKIIVSKAECDSEGRNISQTFNNIQNGTIIVGKAVADSEGRNIAQTFNNIENGTIVVGKAAQDSEGNDIATTYTKITDLEDGSIIVLKAAQDSEGNDIATTYFKKENISISLISGSEGSDDKVPSEKAVIVALKAKQNKLLAGAAIDSNKLTSEDIVEVCYDDETIHMNTDRDLEAKDVRLSGLVAASYSEGLLTNVLDIGAITAVVDNTLADLNTVNEKVATLSGTFRGGYDSLTDLQTKYPVGTTYSTKPFDLMNNDWAYVGYKDSEGNNWMVREKAVCTATYDASGAVTAWTLASWSEEYKFKVSAFSAKENAALQSGINSATVTTLTDHVDATKQFENVDTWSELLTATGTTAENIKETLLGASHKTETVLTKEVADTTYKKLQTAQSDPTASGNATSYIDSISQDTQGVITATKKTIPTASSSTAGLAKAGTGISAATDGTLSISAEKGVQISSDKIGHTNNVTANTTSGLKKFTYDAQGHINAAATDVTVGNGVTIDSSNVLGHSNSVTAGTAGTSSATSGVTAAIPYVTYDAQGHVTAAGTHTHTVPVATTSATGVVQPDGTTITITSAGKISAVSSSSGVKVDGVTTSDILTSTAHPYSSTNRLATMSDISSAGGGTVTSVAAGDGLKTASGSAITSTGTIQADYTKVQQKLTAGTNITISGTTISATDTTYESKSAASGGTAVSLVTTGEKYTWNNKQDKLTAGTNITISGTTISATDTTYSSKSAASGGTDVSLVTTGEKYTWNNKQDKLTAGSNITISGNTISATNTTYSAGTGLSLSGTTINHSNSITVQTAGLKSLAFDAQGHITSATNKTLGRGISDSSSVIGHEKTYTADSTSGLKYFTTDAYGHVSALVDKTLGRGIDDQTNVIGHSNSLGSETQCSTVNAAGNLAKETAVETGLDNLSFQYDEYGHIKNKMYQRKRYGTCKLTTTWTGSAAPYTQVVTIDTTDMKLTTSDNPVLGVLVTDNTTASDEVTAWSKVYKAETTGSNQITFYATEATTTEITVQIRN